MFQTLSFGNFIKIYTSFNIVKILKIKDIKEANNSSETLGTLFDNNENLKFKYNNNIPQQKPK